MFKGLLEKESRKPSFVCSIHVQSEKAPVMTLSFPLPLLTKSKGAEQQTSVHREGL